MRHNLSCDLSRLYPVLSLNLSPRLNDMSGKFDHDRDDQPPLHDGLSAAPDELLPTLADSGNLQKGAGMDTDSHGLEESEKSIPDVDEPFSAYTRREKWFIVAVSSFAGLFRSVSPLFWILCDPRTHIRPKSSDSQCISSCYPNHCKRIPYFH